MGADKNSPTEQDICPKINPRRLFSNRQSDTRQQVTNSPYERLGKARRKAEAQINQNARSMSQSGCQCRTIYSSKAITVQLSLTKHAIIEQRLAHVKTKRKQSLSKRLIKSLTKNIN